MVLIGTLYSGFYIWMRRESFGDGNKRIKKRGQLKKKN